MELAMVLAAIWSDASKLTDVQIARIRQSSFLVRKGDVFIKNEAKVIRAEWAVSSEQELILASCCLSLMRRNSDVLQKYCKYRLLCYLLFLFCELRLNRRCKLL